MRAPPVHRMEVGSQETFSYRADAYLALLDLDTYARVVGPQADGLDMRAHLQRQTQQLTILAWDVRQALSRIQLAIIPEDQPMERLVPTGRQPFANGWIRSFGRLLLINNELLEACARDVERDWLHDETSEGRPRVFLVPPGTFAVSVFAGDEPISDLIVLRHHPFPPPRVAPVRLGGLAPSGDLDDRL